MAFPEGFVEEVRRAADIVKVISEHVALKKMGSSWKGLCPFHEEKTPSFNVRQEPAVFHCFGCGEGGDVFKFLMLRERVSFHVNNGDLGEARRHILAALECVQKMPEGFWKDKFLREIRRDHKRVIESAPKAKLNRILQEELGG